jgi:16S rRNA (cytosine967-C5)-methyltransferase
MPAPSPRQLAYDLLCHWQQSDVFAEVLLQDIDRQYPLMPSDRGLLQALVMGVLRHGSLLDAWTDHLRDRGRIKEKLRWIIRIGLEQLLCMRLTPHAAVSETVALAGRHERALVNAILRRADREREALWALAEKMPLATRYSLPEFLVQRWQQQFGPESTRMLCERLDEPAKIYVRRQSLKPEASPPPRSKPVPDYPEFYAVSSLPKEWLAAGHGSVQDPATWGAIALLAPQPGERILDACAAPGGKSALLFQIGQGQVQLTSTDSNEARLQRLRENFSKLGITAAVRQIDWAQPVPVAERYDAILLDVPCSNTGVIQRRVDVRWQLDEAKVKSLVALQRQIITQVIPHLAPGGRLIYSTCSLEPEENADQVTWIEQQFPELVCEETRFSAPHLTGYDGAFAARLRKKDIG